MDVKDAETFIQGLEDRSKMFNKTETTDEITPMLVPSQPHTHKLSSASAKKLEEIGKGIPDMDLYKNITSDVHDAEEMIAPGKNVQPYIPQSQVQEKAPKPQLQQQ